MIFNIKYYILICIIHIKGGHAYAQKISFRLFIATLLLSLITLLSGCGSNDSSSSTEAKEEPIVQNSTTESARFSSEKVKVSGEAAADYHFDVSYIITDNETGQQWLYVYHSGGYSGGAAMVELVTTAEPSNMEE